MANKANDDIDDEEMPYITSVKLGGFQVFDKPTTIPLGQLTFLFGPNSAGKSAIEDGLAFLLGALKNNSTYGLVTEDLRRHWRRVNEECVPFLTMGLTASIPTNIRACLDVPNEDRGSSYPTYGHEIGINFRFSYDANDGEFNACALFELNINGIPLLELDEGTHIGVNFSHPILAGFMLSGDYQTLSERTPSLVSFENGWARIRSGCSWFQKERIDRETFWDGLKLTAKWSDPPTENWQLCDQMIRTAADEVAAFFESIKEITLGNITISPDIVPASRKVPTPKELTFLFAWDDSLLEESDLVTQSSAQYRNLASSCLAKRTGATDLNRDSELVDNVNRALSDHLFLERGYRVNADFRVIADFDEMEALVTPDARELANMPCLVHVYLRDSQGRKQAFDQVGSGLGYVLPVLCSVADRHVSISLVQQPELHLHPALQAALGDVFVEFSGNQHQVIVETHSEHVLLRVLKRIRQSSQGKAPIPDLQLRPDDVVVAYFDPKPDGTTTVKRLRISEDGEFLDRWPRGFFTERDGELFDE